MVILWASLGMVLRDSLGTGLMMAEARGLSLISAILDALGDLAGILCMVLGAGEVITHGLTAQTAGVVAAMVITSFFTTLAAVKVANRWMPKRED